MTPHRWTFAIHYARTKGDALRVLSQLKPAIAQAILTHLEEDIPCLICADPYDFDDMITPHAFIFAIHPSGLIYTATACRACLTTHDDREKLFVKCVVRFKRESGQDMDPATLRLHKKEAADATATMLAKLRKARI